MSARSVSDFIARPPVVTPSGGVPETLTPTLSPRPRSSAASTLLATLALIAVLWWGQRFVVPVVAGVMLAMLLGPVVNRLHRLLRVRALAATVVLLLVLGLMVSAALVFGGQLVRVANRVPEMISLAAQRLEDSDPGADSLYARARVSLGELDKAAERLAGAQAVLQTPVKPVVPRVLQRGPARTQTGVVVPVVPAVAAEATPAVPSFDGGPVTAPFSEGATVALRATAVSGSGALLRFAGDMTIVLFVAFFVLFGGQSLSQRVLDQWGHDPAARLRAASVLNECSRQIRLYAGVLLVTNVLIGLMVWLVFSASGLPDAAGWGVTAVVLHLVPYLGMALLTGLGAAESFLAHGSWTAAIAMSGFLVLLSTVLGTLVTAWLQGRAAKMNSSAVFIGLVFWGALWGVWGLFLGPALVVLLKVVAEHSQSGRRLALLMQG